SVVATFIAVKKYGRAFGTRSLRKIVQSLAAYDRMSSTAAGSTSTRPRTTLAMTGKNTRIAAIRALDNGLTRPNQLFSSGAKAMIGTAFAATASGRRIPRAVTQRTDAKATRSPTVVPMTRPVSASWSVAVADGSNAKRPSAQFACSAARIAVGFGRTNAWRFSAPTTTSQSTI